MRWGWGTFFSPSQSCEPDSSSMLIVGWTNDLAIRSVRLPGIWSSWHVSINIFPCEHFQTLPLWSFLQKFLGIYSCSLLAKTRCPNCAWHCHRSNMCWCHLGTKLALLCTVCTCLVCKRHNAELSWGYKASPSTYCPARGSAGNSIEVPTSSWVVSLEDKLPSKNGNVGAFLLGIFAFHI